MRSFRSNYFSEKFIYTLAFVENKVYLKSGAIFAADRAVSLECHEKPTHDNLGTSTKMYLTGGIHVKPLVRNKLHTPPSHPLHTPPSHPLSSEREREMTTEAVKVDRNPPITAYEHDLSTPLSQTFLFS